LLCGLWSNTLQPSTLNTSYEKIRFVLNHSLNRHRVFHFLRRKEGNDCDFNYGGQHNVHQEGWKEDCRHGSGSVAGSLTEEESRR